MARQYVINGETMLAVKGASDGPLANLSLLGLTDATGIVRITPGIKHKDIAVDAWGGGEVPAEIQAFCSDVMIQLTLVHFDPAVVRAIVATSMTSPGYVDGVLPRTGTLLGNAASRFAPNWNYVELNCYSPVGQLPWRFYNTCLYGNPMTWPLGTEKSLVDLNFRGIAWNNDPWNNGLGSLGAVLWDHVLST